MAQAKNARRTLNGELKKIGRLVGKPKATKRLNLGIREIDTPLVSLLAAGYGSLPYALPPGAEPPLLTVRGSLLSTGKSAKKRQKRRAAS